MCYNIASVLWFLAAKHVGLIAPQPGIEPMLPELEGKILATGPTGKS